MRSVRGVVGINAALYEHKGGDATRIDWSDPDLSLIANTLPGRRVAEHVEVAPGGNAVICFLDVAARDDARTEAVEEAISRLREQIAGKARRRILFRQVAVEFSVNLGSVDRNRELFEELQDLALRLLTTRPTQAWRQYPPVTIVVTSDSERWQYALAPDDRKKVAALLPPGSAVTSVSVPIDVADDFKVLHGELYPYVTEWVTNLPRARLLELGGVRFVHNEREVWIWPKR